MVNRGSIAGREKIFSLLQNVPTRSGTHPAFYAMDTAVPFQGLKRPARDADQLYLVTKLITRDKPSWRTHRKFVRLTMSQ
jgi:hypothetical protein